MTTHGRIFRIVKPNETPYQIFYSTLGFVQFGSGIKRQVAATYAKYAIFFFHSVTTSRYNPKIIFVKYQSHVVKEIYLPLPSSPVSIVLGVYLEGNDFFFKAVVSVPGSSSRSNLVHLVGNILDTSG
jgi:hypothetical protein